MRYSAPPTWEGKVAQVKDLAQRAAVKKRKLEVAAQDLVDRGGHHMVDAQGMAGLEGRAVDGALIDELVDAGELSVESEEGD